MNISEVLDSLDPGLLVFLDSLPSVEGVHRWVEVSRQAGATVYECDRCGRQVPLYDGYFTIHTIQFDPCTGKKKDFGGL